MRNLLRLIGRFRKDKRGNIAVIFAIACIPLISAVGCAVDYSLATRMRAKMQSAADGAAVASISKRSLGYVAAAAMTGNGSVTAGVTDANNIFDGNINNVTGYTNLTRTSTVTKTGVKLTSNITFSADVPVTFMKVVGFQTLTVTGSSSAASSLPPYLDFYLLLDVSGSMGLPSTPGEQARLAAVNPDNFRDYTTGCTFACHLAPKGSCAAPTNPTQQYQSGYPTNGYCLGYLISRVSYSGYQSLLSPTTSATNYYPKKQLLPPTIVSGLPNSLFAATGPNPNAPTGANLTAVQNCPSPGTDACIQLRLDAVGYAVNDPQYGLLALARQKTVVTNQFRIGLYPFITDIDKTYAPLAATISAGSALDTAAQNLASELDTNTNANLGSGGTNIAKALNSTNNLITSVGTGTSTTNTQPYVFLVTDGAVDPQVKPIGGNFSGPPTNRATVIASPGSTVNPGTSPCKALKDRGIIVSVLYIPYQPITNVNVNYAGNEDTYANNNIPNIPPSLQACASPPDAAGTYFYTANTPTDIQNSLNAMFNHALQTAHITN
jgi:Flp pilus assembly protein TadG